MVSTILPFRQLGGMMHICFLTGEYPPEPHGGIGVFVQTLGRALVKAGHRVSAIGAYQRKQAEITFDEGVQVIRLPSSRTFKVGALYNAWRINHALQNLHKHSPIDIVETPELGHAFSPKTTPWNKVIRMNGGHHFFSVTTGHKPRLLRAQLESRSFQRADALCAVSRFVAETTRELLNLGTRSIEILPNPVETMFFSPRETTFEESGLVIFVGTIVEKKGVKQLVQAMPLVVAEVPNARLILIGRDYPDPKTRSSTIAMLQEKIPSSLRETIMFCGAVNHQDLPVHLSKAQICVFPSHMEAQGIVVVEAMAMQKAVVCTETGPGPEMIEDEVSGLLCDPYSPHSIAEKITRLLSDEKLRTRLARAARERAVADFSIDHLVEANLEFYQRVVENGAR